LLERLVETIGVRDWIPISARPFLLPAPAQFCLEEDWFGVVFELAGTVVVTASGNWTAWNRGFAGEIIDC